MAKKTTGRFQTRQELEEKIVYLYKETDCGVSRIARNVGVSEGTVDSILERKLKPVKENTVEEFKHMPTLDPYRDDPVVKKAREIARWAHRGQKRKYLGQPYFIHCETVAALVAEKCSDPKLIAAAYLHDVVEDTDHDNDFIKDLFGPWVAQLVEELTDVFIHEEYPYLNRDKRKELECIRLGQVTPEAKLIKICDLSDNTSDIVNNAPGFAELYLREKSALLGVLTDDQGIPFKLERRCPWCGEILNTKTKYVIGAKGKEFCGAPCRGEEDQPNTAYEEIIDGALFRLYHDGDRYSGYKGKDRIGTFSRVSDFKDTLKGHRLEDSFPSTRQPYE